MILITEEYRALNRQLHAAKPHYGAAGHRWAEHIVRLIRAVDIRSVLDYGAGKGTLGERLRSEFPTLDVMAYDPARPGYDRLPLPADLVTCCDVLEHVEPACLDDVLDDIQRCARRFVFLVVATKPAAKHLPDGRNTHLIVEPAEWWLGHILGRWRLVDFSTADAVGQLDAGFIAVCKP